MNTGLEGNDRKKVKPRIIAEKFIPGLDARDSVEYKLTFFNGKVKLITVCSGIPHVALSERNNDNYDENWNYLSFFAFYKNTGVQIEKPEQMDKMISLFERLA